MRFMTYDNLRIALRSFTSRPAFRTFWVHLTGGELLEVRHPEALSFRGKIAVFLSTRNEHTVFDSESVSSISQQKLVGDMA